MSVYDLVMGNFNYTLNRTFGIPSLEGYYPFYMYRGKHAVIPDASNSGGQPFGKIDMAQNEMFNLKGEPQSHLFNDSMLGRKFEGKKILGDIPYINKLYFFSFDFVTTQKYANSYVFNSKFIEIVFYDDLQAEIFTLTFALIINLLSGTSGFSGSYTFVVNIYKNNILLENKISTYTIVNESPIVTDSLLNQPFLFANDFEKNLNMKYLLSKQNLVLKVRPINFWKF